MFQQLILLALLAYNSLAFRLSHNKDDHHRWRRSNEPSVATTESSEASGSDVIGNDGCNCEKGFIEPFTIYAEPGEQTALVDFPEPKVENCPDVIRKEVSPNRTLPARFGLGKHIITYSFWYKVDGQREDHIKCFVSFTVANRSRWRRGKPAVATIEPPITGVQEESRCTCGKGFVPPTVYAKPGEQTALVNFPDPEVQYCADLVRKEVNPKVLPARFGLGKHVMTYSFWYKVNDQPEDKTNCFVNFTVAPCECPTRVVSVKVKPGETEADVSGLTPEPSCPANPKTGNPSNKGRFSVGKHSRTFKFKATHVFAPFDIECQVKIIVTGKFCGNTTYDQATHVCCCGLVHEKNSGYECCGKNYYNPSEQICCADSNLQPIDKQCP